MAYVFVKTQYDPTAQYIESIISGGHALIDVQPGIGGDAVRLASSLPSPGRMMMTE